MNTQFHQQLTAPNLENVAHLQTFKDGIAKTQAAPRLALSTRNANVQMNVVKAQCEPAPSRKLNFPTAKPEQASDPIVLESSILPPNVTDIDEGDEAYLEFSAVYVKDIYQYLFKLETRRPAKSQYLLKHPALKPNMRMILVEWLVSLQTRFRLLQETLLLTISTLDRFMSETDVEISRGKFQLVGITCLLIACKYEEMYLPSIADLAYMCDGAYKPEEIMEMERHILVTIQFDLSKPLSAHFLRRFSKAAAGDSLTHTVAKYFLELALYDYSLVHCNPSAIAAASLLIAGQVTKAVHWDDALKYYSTYRAKDLLFITAKLAAAGASAPSNKHLKTTLKKYSTEKFWNVAQHVANSKVVHQLGEA